MLKEVIQEKWKECFKNKDALGKSAFECVKAKIQVVEKSGNYTLPIDDSIVEEIINKEVKELKETQGFYNMDNPMYKDIEYKISLLSVYLPKQLSEDEVKEIIIKLKEKESNMGKLIGLTVKEVGSRFDKSKIAGLVKVLM